MTDAGTLGPRLGLDPPGDRGGGELPELAGVSWRERVDERALGRMDRRWTLNTVGHQVPFLATAVGMPLLSPILAPVSLGALAFAWLIPNLYAGRGAGVLRPPRPSRPRGPTTGSAAGPESRLESGAESGAESPSESGAESRALGMLGDLVGHDARSLLRETGLALEHGRLGEWLIGPAGALLVRPGGRRVQCYCVRVTGDDLPAADRVAHLLLALRADESGFATVANLTFSGACWRIRRTLTPIARPGLDAAIAAAR